MILLEGDMTRRHYQPAGKSAVCGAKSRAVDAEAAGETERFAILRVPTTSDVTKVECPHCREWLRRVILSYPQEQP